MKLTALFRVAGVAFCAILCASFSSARAQSSAPDPGALMHPIQTPPPAAAVAPPMAPPAAVALQNAMGEAYVLGSGDKIRLIVFGEKDLSGEFYIDSTGKAALPLIGEIKAAGLSVRDFENSVETQLRTGYLNDPRVSVEVLNFRPFYILGEVTRPGTYPYTSALTLFNAVATAGGFTYRANTHTVKIKHEGEEKELDVKVTPNLLLQPGDTVRVKERWY